MRLLLPLLALAACATQGPLPRTFPVLPDDGHSFARPNEVRSTHVDLQLVLDFDKHCAEGVVTHHLHRIDPRASLILDTKGLVIGGVADQAGQALPHRFRQQDNILGTELVVDLRDDTTQAKVSYRTTDECDAMQWLSPEQTSGGVAPFVFTQGQAILTRTWIPVQDTPAVRITWTAEITAPPRLAVVMSATERSVAGNVTSFRMDKPVPSYLIALACGDLTSRAISQRCAVWAEPSTIELAASEFSDMESMVAACEQLFGPYRWGRSDLLVLPPSFPFGGMENPCLTFATPTVLAGDKSLVSLVAHELAHGWSGNLVTNATWRDFWLNEGFTVYLERRIMEQIYGTDRATMEAALGMQGLDNALRNLPPDDQILHIDLAGRNPDDGVTRVPYEKGAAFLRRLEQVFGRSRLDTFLRDWFDSHAFQSVTTDSFLAFLDEKLLRTDPARGQQVDVAAWVRAAGLPAEAAKPESELFATVDEAKARWLIGVTAGNLNAKDWVTQQWLRFFDGLDSLSVERLAELDSAFALTRSDNSEILTAWLVLAVKNGYRAVDRRLDLFLMTVGRRKFLRPLYEALLVAPNGTERALAIYTKARPRYHAVAQRTLDAMIGYAAK